MFICDTTDEGGHIDGSKFMRASNMTRILESLRHCSVIKQKGESSEIVTHIYANGLYKTIQRKKIRNKKQGNNDMKDDDTKENLMGVQSNIVTTFTTTTYLQRGIGSISGFPGIELRILLSNTKKHTDKFKEPKSQPVRVEIRNTHTSSP